MTTRSRLLSPTASARLVAVAVAAFACLAAPAQAAGPAAPASGGAWVLASGGTSWRELSPAQQNVLSPLASEWDKLDATGKEKWLEVAGRFPRMKPDDQARVRARMVEWVRMTPQQRSRARLVFTESRDVSKEQRQQLWQEYQALPEDKKKELAQKELARRSVPASAAPSTGARPRPVPDIDEVQPKSNVVRTPNPATAAPRPVAPVIVQGRPGATTTLVNKSPLPPRHQQDGQAKIAVGENEVDRTTLLPRKGPQRPGASAAPPRPPAPPASR